MNKYISICAQIYEITKDVNLLINLMLSSKGKLFIQHIQIYKALCSDL